MDLQNYQPRYTLHSDQTGRRKLPGIVSMVDKICGGEVVLTSHVPKVTHFEIYARMGLNLAL